MTSPKALYWGDNGIHEFWGTEDRELLILRNHGEYWWTALRNHAFLFTCRFPEEATSRINAVLSQERVWKKLPCGRFVLVDRTSDPRPATRRESETG